MKVVADGRHSVPTEIRISTDTGESELVSLPAIKTRRAINSVVDVPLRFPRLSGSPIRFTVEAMRQVKTVNWYSEKPITMPVGIAEVGLPGVHFTPELAPAQIPAVCRSDLLRIDGRPVWIKILGRVRRGREAPRTGAEGVRMRARCGGHQARGRDPHTGGDVGQDHRLGPGPARARLCSRWRRPRPARGRHGSAGSGDDRNSVVATPGSPDRAGAGIVGDDGEARGRRRHASFLAGPRAEPERRLGSDRSGRATLGAPQLIDGYANGWYVTPPTGGGDFTVSLQFGPQRLVTPAIFVSGGTLLVCAMVGFVPIGTVRRRLRRRQARRRAHSTDNRGAGAAAGDLARPPPLIEAPRLVSPLSAGGSAPNLFACLLIAAGCGVLALAVVPPHWAIPVAGATAIAALATLRFSAARSALSLSAVACIVAAGVLTVVGQIRYHYPPGDSVAGQLETAGILAFVGVVALMTDAVVEFARRHRGVGAEPQPPELPGSHERSPPT